MQAARHAAAAFQLGLARPLPSLRDLLPSILTQRASLATHGVGEGSTMDGVPRFYKTVHVKDAHDEVRPAAAARRCRLLACPALGASLCHRRVRLTLRPTTPPRCCQQGGYQVLLDHRMLRTPARHPLVVPSRALALAIAAEWEWQLKRIQPFTMPLMSLAATAIDQPKQREEVIATLLQYLPTDSVLCRDEPGLLPERQRLAERQKQVGGVAGVGRRSGALLLGWRCQALPSLDGWMPAGNTHSPLLLLPPGPQAHT